MVILNPNSLSALARINEAGAIRVTDKVELFKELVRAGNTPNEAKKIVIERFNLQRGKATGTPKWMTRGKQELIAEGFDYKDSPRGPANVGGRKKAQTKRSAILENLDERLKRTKQKTGLGKQYELAHTANIFQAKKLGIDYPIDALAIQTQNVNNKVAEALNDELKPLYRKQLKLFNKMKRKNTPSLIKQMDKINFQIGELVATGGSQGSVAANVLKPIIVDPNTVKGKILDLGFDTSTEIMASPGATTKVAAGSPDDLFARANIESRLQNVRKQFENNTDNVCSIFGKANGGSVKACLTSFDNAVKKNPQGLFQKIVNFAKSPGVKRFGIAGAVGAAIGAVKEFNNNDPTTYLSDENQQKNMLVDMFTDPITTEMATPAILDYQLPILGAEAAAVTAAATPKTLKAVKKYNRGLGVEEKPIGNVKTGAKILGRGLAALGTPAALLPMEAMNISRQLSEGDSIEDIATDPLNYLGAAFVGPASTIASRSVNPTVAKILRLGINPRTLRTVSSRFGLPGLALSLGFTAYDKLTD
jgi:hypothetical protein